MKLYLWFNKNQFDVSNSVYSLLKLIWYIYLFWFSITNLVFLKLYFWFSKVNMIHQTQYINKNLFNLSNSVLWFTKTNLIYQPFLWLVKPSVSRYYFIFKHKFCGESKFFILANTIFTNFHVYFIWLLIKALFSFSS